MDEHVILCIGQNIQFLRVESNMSRYCTLLLAHKKGLKNYTDDNSNSFTQVCTYTRWFRIFLDIKVLWSVKAIVSQLVRQPTGQTQDNFNFGPSLLKF